MTEAISLRSSVFGVLFFCFFFSKMSMLVHLPTSNNIYYSVNNKFNILENLGGVNLTSDDKNKLVIRDAH